MELKVNTHKTIILPVVLYGYETWFLILREKHRLRVFENKVLGKKFGLREMKLQETGESYLMLSLQSLPNIITNLTLRRLTWSGHVARMGLSRNASILLV